MDGSAEMGGGSVGAGAKGKGSDRLMGTGLPLEMVRLLEPPGMTAGL